MSILGWRKRKQGTPNQIGQAFPIEPHGDKSKLPKSLQQVSFSEVRDFYDKRKRKGMTPEEIAEEEMVEEAVNEAVAEVEAEKRNRKLLEKLSEKIEQMQRKEELKKAMQQAKEEQLRNAAADGDEKAQEQIDKIDKANEKQEMANFNNEVMG